MFLNTCFKTISHLLW